MQKIIRFFLLIFILSASQLLGNERVHGPYLQDVRPSEITILWETESPAIGKVLFGKEADVLNMSVAENEPKSLHQVRLSNLQPRQQYFYKCVWHNGESAVGSFRTAPANETTPLRFAVVGDSRSDLVMCKKISDLIVASNPDIVLHSGDIVARGKNLHEWKTFLFDPMEELLRNIPIYPVLGNHEQESPHYYNFFPLHENKPWWSRDYGPVHIIGLDTSVPTDPQSEQYQFLLADLKQNTKEWTIVVFHYPLFHAHPTRPIYEFRYDWQPLFMEHGVDLALTGHDHYYHRSFPIGRMAEDQKGVVHITSAGGGASLYPIAPEPYSAYYRSLYHFLTIDVTENELEIRAIDQDNRVFDGIILNKNQDYSPANFVEYGMFELERKLKNQLGQLSPTNSKNNVVFFDTTFAIETDFYMPVSGHYEWQAGSAWKLKSSSKNFTLTPGQKLQIKFSGEVDKKNFMPTPELKLHLEADNSTRNVLGHRPYQRFLGFRNQDLHFSIEEAAYKNAVLSSVENLQPVFYFLDYYAESKYAYDVIVALGTRILRTQDRRILTNLETLLQKNPSDLNKFRIFPFYFLFNDFSHLEEWIAVMGRLPSEHLSFAPKLICTLTDLDFFNTNKVENWQLLGPFAAEKGQGLVHVYPPEQELNFTKKYDAGTGAEVQWHPYAGKTIDLLKALTAPDFAFKEGIAYAHTTVSASKDGEILLLLGSNDDPAVWVNNKEVHRKKGGRSEQACQDMIIAPVKKGRNDILIKVGQHGGAWGLNLRISDWKKILE
ncbi:MAG: hypothetical protein DWQ05_05995 [Calditrichaeota bacterium]|nr:MAG: hypothetical protein DWQ05_05995 [Calditrichota bacterium]